jgi:hypothetical protein
MVFRCDRKYGQRGRARCELPVRFAAKVSGEFTIQMTFHDAEETATTHHGSLLRKASGVLSVALARVRVSETVSP